MFSYPHPLINQGAGRIKTDAQNEKRIELVLDRYAEWMEKKKGIKLNYPITKQQAQKATLVFPTVGAAIGLLGSYAFAHPSSKYIGKCFTLSTIVLGYWLSQRYHKSYRSLRSFQHFPNFPGDIQKMIDNNDARYSHRWLKDDYLNINQA